MTSQERKTNQPRATWMHRIEYRCARSVVSLGRGDKSVIWQGGIKVGKVVGKRIADGGWKMRVGMVNVVTMCGRDGDVVDMLKRRKTDICCLQETRWRGTEAELISDGWSVMQLRWVLV